MKNAILKTKYVVLAFLVALSFSCSPEDGAPGAIGPAGANGTNGTDGQDASINITTIQPPGCQSVSTLTSSFQKIADLGDFMKLENSSFIEIDYQTNFKATFSGATGVVYQLRVDENPTTFGEAALLLRPDNNSLPGVIHGVFTNLNPDSHTISIWVKEINGNATNAFIDAGCFNGANTNNIIVKEFR